MTISSAHTLTPAARTDLIEIWDYTRTTWSLQQAITYDDALADAFEALAAEPLRGLDLSDVRADYRRWSVGRHYIFYRQMSDTVEIVRILHQARDIDRHLPNTSK